MNFWALCMCAISAHLNVIAKRLNTRACLTFKRLRHESRAPDIARAIERPPDPALTDAFLVGQNDYKPSVSIRYSEFIKYM